jgi:hypothetical protein
VVAVVVVIRSGGPRSSRPPCQVVAASATYPLALDQAANATTIAAVAKRMGLPDHAVSVALAAALQESGLHNIDFGDRDSLGLFQQRPSQGWGTPDQIMTPSYAAGAFFGHLALIAGWQNLPVTEAAQQVQRSAAPDAYAPWEAEARVLAQAMTGEVPAGLACQYRAEPGPTQDGSLAAGLAKEIGQPGIGAVVTTARGWTVANWLVGHAQQYVIGSVTFNGQMWTAKTGAWQPALPADLQVQIGRVPA